MTIRSRIVLGALWVLSLVIVAEWKALAQVRPDTAGIVEPVRPRADASLTPPGVEVRFMRGQGAGGVVTGTLVANIGGQWLPVKLVAAPDGNQPR